MKIKLIALLLLLPAVGWGQTIPKDFTGIVEDRHGVTAYQNGKIVWDNGGGYRGTEVLPNDADIRRWAASGEICRVLDFHSYARIPMFDGSLWTLRRVGWKFRCQVCGHEVIEKD